MRTTFSIVRVMVNRSSSWGTFVSGFKCRCIVYVCYVLK